MLPGMGREPAARPSKRRIYWIVAGCILGYLAMITAATVVLWHRKMINDAASLGSYATAVLAVSTIVLFGATALLAAATVDLVRAEMEEARREEEKYELERDARIEQENLRAQQATVYALQTRELERRLSEQERAQARAVHMAVATLSIVMPGSSAHLCRVVRVENRSYLPVRQCQCTATYSDGTIEYAQPGILAGSLTASRLTDFTAHQPTPQALIIEPGRHTDFAFLDNTDGADRNEPLVSFTDAAGLAWQLDAYLTLKPVPRVAEDSVAMRARLVP
jgi:membrane protein implicated in regulation of membrane protease activity